MVTIIFILLLLLTNISLSCNLNLLKISSERYFGSEYPYYYSYAQMLKESNCKWVVSLDGYGSIGYGQITPSMWDKRLLPIHPNYKQKDSLDHYLAQHYILKENYKTLYKYCDNKVWSTYQLYNRYGLLYDVRDVGCDYNKAKERCEKVRNKNICVWKLKDGTCKQYRTSCDINYTYGMTIYTTGQDIRRKNALPIFRKYEYW